MSASEARGRGDSPLERYVRQLLREGDRARRLPPPRIRTVQDDRPVPSPLLPRPDGSLTDDPPARAG